MSLIATFLSIWETSGTMVVLSQLQLKVIQSQFEPLLMSTSTYVPTEVCIKSGVGESWLKQKRRRQLTYWKMMGVGLDMG